MLGPPLDPVLLSSRSEKEEACVPAVEGSDGCLESLKWRKRRPLQQPSVLS